MKKETIDFGEGKISSLFGKLFFPDTRRNGQRVVPATVFAMMRGFLFLVPCFVFLPELVGVEGIWLALPMSEIMTAAAILIHFIGRKHGWRMCER